MELIDKSAVVAEIEKKLADILVCKKDASTPEERIILTNMILLYKGLLSFIDTLEVKEGKQIIIITESDGDAHIHWDCRSLEDVNTLLDCAKSFIIDRQTEDVRGKGSFPDYNTEEGRYKKLFTKSSEVKEMDLEKEIEVWEDSFKHCPASMEYKETAKHFFELGLRSTITEKDCKLIWNIGDEIPQNMPENDFF